MNKPVTIKDIAKALNLHHATVSRALRDHPAINPETRKKIQGIAREMGYTRNTLAAALSSRKSRTLAVMVPDIQPWFFASFISSVSTLAEQAGYTVMIFQSNDALKTEQQNTRAIIQNRVAGLIVSVTSETDHYEHFEQVRQQGIPVVFFDRVPRDLPGRKIMIDNYRGAFTATEYLINRGRRNIAFIAAPRDVSIFYERLQGYQSALEQNGFAHYPDRTIHADLSISGGKMAAQQLLSVPDTPDAILCTVDLQAFGAMRVIHDLALKIPTDIALIGFDDHPAGEIVFPTLTTVAQPIAGIAGAAFECVMQAIENPGADHQNPAPLPMELICRNSA